MYLCKNTLFGDIMVSKLSCSARSAVGGTVWHDSMCAVKFHVCPGPRLEWHILPGAPQVHYPLGLELFCKNVSLLVDLLNYHN